MTVADIFKSFFFIWPVFSPWKNRDFQSITQSFDATPRKTAYEQNGKLYPNGLPIN